MGVVLSEMRPRFYFAPLKCAHARILQSTCIFVLHRHNNMASAPAEDLGVYDCEFVVPPPEAFQAECPVCLMVLKEPCVIDCPCGQKMCRECVE